MLRWTKQIAAWKKEAQVEFSAERVFLLKPSMKIYQGGYTNSVYINTIIPALIKVLWMYLTISPYGTNLRISIPTNKSINMLFFQTGGCLPSFSSNTVLNCKLRGEKNS